MAVAVTDLDRRAATFGKVIGRSLGIDTELPGDWAGYGRAAESAIGAKRPVPDPAKFGIHAASPPTVEERSVVTDQAQEAEVRTGRHVGFGPYDISLNERPRAPYRTQHNARRGERTSGRYRERPPWCGRPR